MSMKLVLTVLVGSLSFGVLASGGESENEYYEQVECSCLSEEDLEEFKVRLNDYTTDEFDIYLPCIWVERCAARKCAKVSLREAILRLIQVQKNYSDPESYLCSGSEIKILEKRMHSFEELLAALDRYQPEKVVGNDYEEEEFGWDCMAIDDVSVVRIWESDWYSKGDGLVRAIYSTINNNSFLTEEEMTVFKVDLKYRLIKGNVDIHEKVKGLDKHKELFKKSDGDSASLVQALEGCIASEQSWIEMNHRKKLHEKKLAFNQDVLEILKDYDENQDSYRAEMFPSNKKWYGLGGLLIAAIAYGVYAVYFGDTDKNEVIAELI